MNNSILYIPIVSIKQVRQSRAKYNSILSKPEDIVDMILPIIKNRDREMVIVVGVDMKNMPNVINIVSIGTLNYSYAVAREIFKPLILSNCAAFFIIHNHVSSGILNPSEADKKMTVSIRDTGKMLEIILLDHLIIGHDRQFYSFKNAGLLQNERTFI
jgi:DNA repair protein RadC